VQVQAQVQVQLKVNCVALQQNLNNRGFATTTSSHMTANKDDKALEPTVGYTVLEEGGPVQKLGWIVLSDDLKHDYMQVRPFFDD